MKPVCSLSSHHVGDMADEEAFDDAKEKFFYERHTRGTFMGPEVECV